MMQFTPAQMSSKDSSNTLNGRQVAFAAAFLLPAAKLLEAPSLLAKYAAGDLLFPAFLHFLLQTGILFALLYAASKSEKTLFERLHLRFGKWCILFYLLYAVYFLFYALLPLLDFEKFTYAVFFDTAPTSFSFVFFFFFSAFACIKGLKSVGRAADLGLFLYLVPFLSLIVMALFATDFTNLLPLFGNKFGNTMSAFTKTTPHFSDTVLLLPLVGNLRIQKGDTKKILLGYGAGAFSTLLFLAVFFGVYSSLASREHYAFAKIAEYFPALAVIGRFDLFFVYMLTVVLLFFTVMPLQYATSFVCDAVRIRSKILISALLNVALLVFILFANRHYNTFYAVISGKLSPVFWIVADAIPLLFLFLKNPKKEKGGAYA